MFGVDDIWRQLSMLDYIATLLLSKSEKKIFGIWHNFWAFLKLKFPLGDIWARYIENGGGGGVS